MCGIAGAYHFSPLPFSPEILERMTLSIAHRGPDDFGHVLFDRQRGAHTWTTETAPCGETRVGLGNRRLKIIDLSTAAHQPMTNDTRTLWLTYNGEIYNYLELRGELVLKGYSFKSHTDSEVILHAYSEWGTDCFKRFNGMWALALYDLRDGSLLLSRDRWGVKPLYVYRDSKSLVFGSEIKALLCHPWVPRRPNYRTIYNYVGRHYRCVDGSRATFYEGIENLPPAHFWKVLPDGRMTEQCYWTLDPTRQDQPASDREALEHFRGLFEDAVRLRLRSDVPIATMLSGGLDSSIVTCVAAKLSGSPITTFSARYVEPEFDEGPYIEATVKYVGADSRLIYPKAGDLLDTLNGMLAFHDEPICTVTWFAHWLVVKEVAGRGFPVLLNGHAGDELFAGYWDHYLYNFADLERADPARFASEFEAWLRNHGRLPDEYARLKVRLATLEAGTLHEADQFADYSNAVSKDFGVQYAGVEPRPNPFAGRERLTSRLYQELVWETVPATLRPEDRNSMAFSIETRSPFLDYRLAEFAFALPNQFKIRNGLGKWILREAMKGILPESVRRRRDKQGFNAPTMHWFRGQNREMVREVLSSRSLADRGILEAKQVLRLFNEHVEGKANHYMAIWQWLNLELWMREFFDTIPSSRLPTNCNALSAQ